MNNQASTSAKWRCATRITYGPKDCKGGSLEESEIQNAVLRALNQTFAGKNNVKEVLKKNVLDIDKNDNSKQMSLVDEKINKLQMKQVSSVQDNKSYDQIVEQLEELRNNKSKLQTEKSIVDANKRRIVDLIKFIDASSFRVEEYEDKLYNRN
ncbi:zinc ribbon domain-containing protein [Fundicoccus sp. Sow4_H7]|uniref:zinc ribbon domain-containing protein n=1 Tax=Fundicoccus sp. Sow4_H7 TaxID=3438784 RepID=UPI003F914029